MLGDEQVAGEPSSDESAEPAELGGCGGGCGVAVGLLLIGLILFFALVIVPNAEDPCFPIPLPDCGWEPDIGDDTTD